ncbi:hypothetical protein M0802_002797 [Mischocyttarus mexicanus]|nr:hypothetical protein M0802_002797 [Mischocyttarus mexicanus]
MKKTLRDIYRSSQASRLRGCFFEEDLRRPGLLLFVLLLARDLQLGSYPRDTGLDWGPGSAHEKTNIEWEPTTGCVKAKRFPMMSSMAVVVPW